jgi:hypothetical protein
MTIEDRYAGVAGRIPEADGAVFRARNVAPVRKHRQSHNPALMTLQDG